jgi:hypothetical protein
MIATCPLCNEKYERLNVGDYGNHNCKPTYDDEINSGNRLVLFGTLLIMFFILMLTFTQAIETKGGIYNGRFEYGTGTNTASGYIGDANYGWATYYNNAVGTTDFNTVTKYSGLQSNRIKIDSNSGGTFYILNMSLDRVNALTPSEIGKRGIRLKSGANYLFSVQVKTNSISNNTGGGAICTVRSLSTTALVANKGNTSYISGTNDWAKKTISFSAGANDIYGMVECQIWKETGEAWFDDVRLEEVDSVSLSTQQQGRPSVTITGVTDTNAIDQSQTTQTNIAYAGNHSSSFTDIFQTFIPKQQKFTGVTLYKGTTEGTPTGNLVIELRDVNATGYPTTTIYSSKTFTLSEWNSYANGEVFIPLPAIVTSDENYAIWIRDSNTSELNGNSYAFYYNIAGGYTNGIQGKYAPLTTTWTLYTALDYYFKTHFAKLSSSVDLNVVAPDGTSELKSYDVNGDILTDANITINPNGTGRYYYKKGNGDSIKFYNDIYQASAGTPAIEFPYALQGWNIIASNGFFNYKNTAERYLTLKVVLPVNCTANGLKLNANLFSSTGSDTNTFVQISNNNTNWTNVINSGIKNNAFSNLSGTSTAIDGNNTFYVRLYKPVGAVAEYLASAGDFIIDANLSCPTLTTPLFKSGTNTIYTMNKDANQQAGATLTPSLMSNLALNFTTPSTIFTATQPTGTNDLNFIFTCTGTYPCTTIKYRLDSNETWNDLNYLATNNKLFEDTDTQQTLLYYAIDNYGNYETTKTTQFPMAIGVTDKENSRILFYGATTYHNITVNDWNWFIDNTKTSDSKDFTYYTAEANIDYNVCLAVGNGTTNYTYCYTQSTWDTIDPEIDVNITFTQGFVTNYDINYSMKCTDNQSPITYQILNDTNYLYNSSDVNATTVSGTLTLTPPSIAPLTFKCKDDWNNEVTYTENTIYLIALRLINEETGAELTSIDFNSDSRLNLKKIVAYSTDGNFEYDFNANATTTKNFLGYTSNLWFELTYNNAGTDTKIDRKIDFSLVSDTNIGVCVPPLQYFYQQDFTSIQTKKVYLYQQNSKCYVLAGTLDYIGENGYSLTTWTIAKPYLAYTVTDSIKIFLASINGAIANSYNLDSIEFNQQAIQIAIGQDTLAFVPTDSNILYIYWNAFNDYEEINISIYNGQTLLYNLIEDTNTDEFVLTWIYTAYGLTDENMLKIVVIGTKEDGTTKTITEYFTIMGEEYTGTKDPSFIAIIVIIFFLFGITMMSVGKTFGWFGLIVCIVSMAITLMAVPTFWLLMIEGGLFICFLFIILSGGLTQKVMG